MGFHTFKWVLEQFQSPWYFRRYRYGTFWRQKVGFRGFSAHFLRSARIMRSVRVMASPRSIGIDPPTMQHRDCGSRNFSNEVQMRGDSFPRIPLDEVPAAWTAVLSRRRLAP
jgi:hypothetical protein